MLVRSVEGEMGIIIRGTELIEERHVELISIRPLRSQLRVLITNNGDDDDDDDDAMINVSPRRAYEQQAYSSRTNQENASADQDSVCLLVMDSGNGRRVRLFGVDLIDGRPVHEEEAVTTDPQLPGPAPSVSVDVEVLDDEEVAPSVSVDVEVLDDEEVAPSVSVDVEESDDEEVMSDDDNMQLEGRPGPSMYEHVAPLPPPRAPFDCPICMGPFVEEVTTKCGHVFLSRLHKKCNFCAIQLSNVQAKGHLPGSYADLPPLWQLSSRCIPFCDYLFQGSVCLLVMDSDNGRWMRIFGIDLLDGRPVLEEEAVTTDPLSGPAPPVQVNLKESDDDEFFVLSRTAFEEVHYVLYACKYNDSKSLGGLGIGSLLAPNLALLTKWLWRFKTETKSLWYSIIISLHGNNCATWNRITSVKKIWSMIRKCGLHMTYSFTILQPKRFGA